MSPWKRSPGINPSADCTLTWATCSKNTYFDNHGREKQGPHECGNTKALPHKHKCSWCGKENG